MLVAVQYCPCGCIGFRTEEELRDLDATSQIEAIQRGEKFDVVTLSTEECGTCQAE